MLVECVFINYNVCMSIPHRLNKIKGQFSLHYSFIVTFFIMIIVALASFGLGRLSVGPTLEPPKASGQPSIENSMPNNVLLNSKASAVESSGKSSKIQNTNNANFVASKNGKLYYKPTCAGAKRIKDANRVWFETPVEAEKAGYSRSKSCK